jgi:hypothetical protein
MATVPFFPRNSKNLLIQDRNVEAMTDGIVHFVHILSKDYDADPKDYDADLNRVYAQNKKEENFGRIEILPFCSKKRVCVKVILEEFPLYKY